jgi:alpha-glucosidase
MIKDELLRDNPPNPAYKASQGSRESLLAIYDADRPEIHQLVAEMRSVLEEFGDRVLIGEIYLPVPRLMDYYGPQLRGAHLPFNFQLLQCPWTADDLAHAINDYLMALPAGAWPNWVLGNHDKSRIATRIGLTKARAAALLLLSLPGTLTIYYGEELGMQDVPIRPDQAQDPAERRQPGIGMGRDPERTPMPWDDSLQCGFTTNQPWLPVGEANRAVNMHTSSKQLDSMLALYLRLLALRRARPVLVSGQLSELSSGDGVLQFVRSDSKKRLRVIVNLAEGARGVAVQPGVISACTSLRREGEVTSSTLYLEDSEGVIFEELT